MATRHRQRDRRFALRRDQHEARAFRIQHDVARGHVGIRIQREADQAMAVGAFLEIRCECVIGIDRRHAVGRQRIVDGGLGVGDAQQTTHALDVRRGDVVHQRHVRTDDVGEVGDVARLAGAHFVDGVQRVFRRIQHRQRQTDLVVAIARRGVGAAGLALRRDRSFQDRERQRLHAGLAVAAGHRQHLCSARALHRCGQRRQRALGIRDHDLRNRHIRLPRDQRGACAACLRLRDVIVAVEMLAFQRDEQRRRGGIGVEPAGVGGPRIDGQIGADEMSVHSLGDAREQQRHHARASSAARAVAVSSNGYWMPSISW